MTNEEAARILDPDTSAEALRPYALDCVMRMAVVEEASRLGAAALRERQRWIPVTERLPENAKYVGALCPVYLVALKYGVTEGWYNPDASGWFIIMKRLTGLHDRECDIDFKRGDVVRVEYAKDGIVTHWMPLPPTPEVKNE